MRFLFFIGNKKPFWDKLVLYADFNNIIGSSFYIIIIYHKWCRFNWNWIFISLLILNDMLFTNLDGSESLIESTFEILEKSN